MAALEVRCACPDPETARALAERLVDEGLAACVQVLPGVQSVYRWHGRVEHAEEALLLIKTAADRFQALSARLHALHPYELPEIVAVELAAGLPAYLAWIEHETRAEGADD
jgi:periplasmic divalent cation tolerance protein